ncbi:MAG: hypothetical protein ACREHG_03985 [Candidatus Saccharimonadales bacterium]
MVMENPDNDETVGQGIDRINAAFFNDAGNRASGMVLDEIGMDGHAVANMLWRISAHLRRRAEAKPVERHSPYPRRIDGLEDLSRWENEGGYHGE